MAGSFFSSMRSTTPVAAVWLLLGGAALLAWYTWHVLRPNRRVRADARDAWVHSQRHEARLDGIIRSAMEGIITVDDTQHVVIFNPMAETLFGCRAADALGAPLERFIPERFRGAHREHVVRFGVTGVSERQMGKQRRLYALRADGSEFPIEASISQIHDEYGRLYTVMLRDITERVRAEDALRVSREELQRLSANIQKMREEEKARIARELHDDLGQQLTALKMEVTLLDNELKATPRVGSPVDLNRVYGLIDQLVGSVRRIAADLRPAMLDDLGLMPSIEWLVNEFSVRYNIRVIKHIDTYEINFTSDGATAVFRMIQEALTNIARHSGATEVMLDIVRDDPHCIVRVADNGRGTACDVRPSADSFGLLGLRERAARLGGLIDVQTAPGRGFVLTVMLPLDAIEAGQTE